VAFAEQLAQQVVGECGGCRVVEHQGRGQPGAGGGAEAVAQFDGGERIEAQVVESALRLDGGR
jgi:hypothetical protein